MEIELNGAKLRVYECGKIERFCKRTWTSKEETWHQLKGGVNILKSGYKIHQTKINNKLFTNSRIIYYAYFPELFDINDPITTIDHINRDSLDNRLVNLRIATMAEQNLNRNNVINQKGYYWKKQNQKWVSRITINGKKQMNIGSYDTEEEARQAYLNAKDSLP